MNVPVRRYGRMRGKMLQSLHVKNLALIQETEVEFGPGLNILTGETGAGKSLLIGSVNLALGGKFDKEMLRTGAESALVELVFSEDSPKVREVLEKLELEPQEEGTVIISRRMQAGKSICRINGETVTARQVKELAECLIDIHGQHEHQSLLHKKNHLGILDGYCGDNILPAAEKVEALYREMRELKEKIAEETMDDAAKMREQSLAEFEYLEIEQAKLIVGEDEELEQRYRLMVNSKRIMESLTESHQYTGGFENGAGENLGRALRAMRSVSMYDGRLAELEEQLNEIDSLLADYNRDLVEYMSDCEFDEEDFSKAEGRLNTLNHLKGKYGGSIEAVLKYAQERKQLLEKLSDYDVYMDELKVRLRKVEEELQEACDKLSKIRNKHAVTLSGKLREALLQLNFPSVEFEIAVRPGQAVSVNGYDDVEFLISTNPGEDIKPLSQVASGGELSRIMLAIKTVLAGRDEVGTLIFDEIDAGISGRTAWKVSEQLDTVARSTQVLCITHLPQIAAMADEHFVIEKSSTDANTITDIRLLEGEESLGELARLLGSDALTEAALTNAREMRGQALKHKGEDAE